MSNIHDNFDHIHAPLEHQVALVEEHQLLLATSQSPRKIKNWRSPENGFENKPSPKASAALTVEDNPQPIVYTELQKSLYIIYLVVLYSLLTVFAWLMLCILSDRPLGLRSYGAIFLTKRLYEGSGTESHFIMSQEWYRTVRIIQAVLSVVTIPMTSAVCSVAAVAYMQRSAKYRRLTLRQTMVLADKSWTDPRIWFRLLNPRQARKYGSSLLLLALGLNLLGGLIAPVEQLVLTTRTIKTPTVARQMQPQYDILDHFSGAQDQAGNFDSNIIPILTRASLAQTSLHDVQSRLWAETSSLCKDVSHVSSNIVDYCISKSATLADLAELGQPFIAQLPPTVNTGLIRQFLPRINSTAYRTVISAEEYPQSCEPGPTTFSVRYSRGDWSFAACMLNSTDVSSWHSTRERQDFSEALYLNISYSWLDYSTDSRHQLSRIVVNTTAGFFELPNYMNDGIPGPLLADSPTKHCGHDCAEQQRDDGLSKRHYNPTNSIMPRSSNASSPYNTSIPAPNLAKRPNKGPLTAIAIALFGEGSFLQRSEQYSAFVTGSSEGYYCIDLAPMQRLLGTSVGQGGIVDPGNRASPVSYCVQKHSTSDRDISNQIQGYIASFTHNDIGPQRIEDAFTAAAFLANEAWLLNPEHRRTLLVSFDMGADTQIPVISRAGKIVVSLLLSVYLLSMLALSIYSARSPHWTENLDSFAMMRIGASISTDLPLDIMYEPHRFDRLDQLPGWIGDGHGYNEHLGTVELGATTPLQGRKRYRSYTADSQSGSGLV